MTSLLERLSQKVGSNRQGERTQCELAIDEVIRLLNSSRRREAVSHLAEHPDDGVSIGAMADHIASLEVDKPVGAVTNKERKRVYISLYQVHLDTLDDADVVDYDQDRGVIEAGDNFEEVLPVIAYLRDRFADGQWDGHEQEPDQGAIAGGAD